MAERKENKVAVVAKDGYVGDFGIEQATTLIRSYGWRLVDGSPYTYSKEYGIRIKPNSGAGVPPEQE